MKNIHLFLTAVLCAASSCSSPEKGELLEVDLSTSAPEKELVLQDISTVRYVALDDSVVVPSRPRLVTDTRIVYVDSEGSFLLFGKDGKYLKQFNHKGQGPGEYPMVRRVLYDAAASWFWVYSGNKLLAYTEDGELRSELALDESLMNLWELVDYDAGHFLGNRMNSTEPYILISKADGAVADTLDLSIRKFVEPYIKAEDGGNIFAITPAFYQIVRSGDGYLLTNLGLDTFFVADRQQGLRPCLRRSESVHGVKEPTFLNAWVEAGGYYFYSTVEKRFAPETQEGFPQEYYLMEKNTGKIYKQHVVNEDIEGQDVRLDPAVIERTQHADEGVLVLQADELLEYAEEGAIKSEALSRIAESLDEDSNPVLMFLSFSGQ